MPKTKEPTDADLEVMMIEYAWRHLSMREAMLVPNPDGESPESSPEEYAEGTEYDAMLKDCK